MIIFKTECPKCHIKCTSEYNGDLSKDELYYSCREINFTCSNCRKGYGPYSFTVPSHKVEMEEVK